MPVPATATPATNAVATTMPFPLVNTFFPPIALWPAAAGRSLSLFAAGSERHIRVRARTRNDGCRGLPDPPRLPLQEVPHHVLPQRQGAGEVRLAAGQLTDFRHELHERRLARQHERIDQDPRFPARPYL